MLLLRVLRVFLVILIIFSSRYIVLCSYMFIVTIKICDRYLLCFYVNSFTEVNFIVIFLFHESLFKLLSSYSEHMTFELL